MKFLARNSFMGTEPCLLVPCGLWLFFFSNGKAECSRIPRGLLSLKYLLPGILKKKFATSNLNHRQYFCIVFPAFRGEFYLAFSLLLLAHSGT